MKKSYSDVLNKSASHAKNSTHLNPGADEFVPKSHDAWPRVNRQNMHGNVPSRPVMDTPIHGARGIGIGESKIEETVTKYSSGGDRFHGKRDANYQENKRSSSLRQMYGGESGNGSEKNRIFYNKETKENWRRTEISKDPSDDRRVPRPPRRMEKEPKNVKHVENPQTLLRNTHAFKKQKPDDRYPAPEPKINLEDFITANTPTTNQSVGAGPQKDVHEYLKEDEQNASASVKNTFSGRGKERKKDKADRSSLPFPNNDRSVTKSKLNDKADRTSSSYLDPRMEREKNKTLEKTPSNTTWFPNTCVESDKKKMERDREFDLWESRSGSWSSDGKVVYEIFGDLFEQPKEYSLAHCVAEDLRMGSGIAVSFKREFKNLPDLLDQRAKQGGLATLHDVKNNRFVYYLVTKKESIGKPTYFTLWKSLCKMRDHVKMNEVKHIAIPRLGCGLDRLDWKKVKSMLICLFDNVDVEIRVCNFQQTDQDQEKKPTQSPLVTRNSHITEIECNTLILYFTTCRGDEDAIMRDLSEKSKFLPEFRKDKRKELGDILYFEDKIQKWGLCGCVVRETDSSQLNFKSLYKCIQNINKKNNGFGNNRFQYIATQWVDSSSYHDELINEKIITMLTTYLRNVRVYVCQGGLENKHK